MIEPGHEISTAATSPPSHDLSAVTIPLLKGVIYQESDAALWNALINLQTRVRDYVAVLGLELVLDEAEGYAFLRSRTAEENDAGPGLPRLIARRPLSFPVSLLLALLRKKLAEFDAGGGDTRLILSRDEVADLIRVFLPESSNEARLVDQVETYLNRIIELGFLRRLTNSPGANLHAKRPKGSGQGQPDMTNSPGANLHAKRPKGSGQGQPDLNPAGGAAPMYEVRRILKAFVDAQWLAEFDQRLAEYRAHLGAPAGNPQDG
jgi:hypothetical protein